MNRLEKLSAVLVAGLLSTPMVQAHDCLSMKGWYAGIQGGVQNTHTKDNVSIAGVGSMAASFGKTHGMVGAMGGYGHMFHNWYVAGQVQGDLGRFNNSNAFTTNGGATGTIRTRADSMFGAAALVGYQALKDVIAYVRVGGDYARWKVSATGINDVKKSQFGFAPGIGVRALIRKNIFLNMEYKHSFFRKVNNGNGSTSVAVRPSVQTFTVGVAFKM